MNTTVRQTPIWRILTAATTIVVALSALAFFISDDVETIQTAPSGITVAAPPASQWDIKATFMCNNGVPQPTFTAREDGDDSWIFHVLRGDEAQSLNESGPNGCTIVWDWLAPNHRSIEVWTVVNGQRPSFGLTTYDPETGHGTTSVDVGQTVEVFFTAPNEVFSGELLMASDAG